MNEQNNNTHSFKNISVLATCQALFFCGRTLTFFAASLVSIGMLGENLTFATVPITMMLIGTSIGTLPAAFLMQAWGRKWGFAFGSTVGCIGALIAAFIAACIEALIGAPIEAFIEARVDALIQAILKRTLQRLLER